MCKVISEIANAGYRSMALDEPRPAKLYANYIIGGRKYEPIASYGSRYGIAIRDTGESMMGKEVQFI